MSAKRIFGSCLVLLGASFLPLMGCGGGVECGPGTIEQDGECVLEGDLECPAGQVRAGGVCVPASDFCADGTTYDADSGTCVADGEGGLTCGPNTVEENGTCVVESPVDCGAGTELDPNANECVVTSAVCGGGTAYDSASDTCLPTGDVCDDGTTFDAELRLCLPGINCQSGDVVVDGLCLSPGQALAAESDFDADGENSNPFLDGELHEIAVDSVFTGTIVAPTDVDGDGDLDQHFDFFAFGAEAGEWFELSVQSLGLPAPHFVIWYLYEDEDGEPVLVDYRQSSAFSGNAKARQFNVPVDSTVIVQVGPEAAFLGAPPVGGDGWHYVGAVDQIDVPTPAAHNFEDDGNLAGTLGMLSDNFFMIEGFSEGDDVQISFEDFPGSADMVVQAWASPTEFIGEWESDFSVTVPEGDEFFLVADWYIAFGSDLDYELSALELIVLDAGETLVVTVEAEAHDILELTQTNASTTALEVTVTGPNGFEETATLGAGVAAFWRSVDVEAGTYEFELTNATEDAVFDVVVSADVISPVLVDDFTMTYSGEGDERAGGQQGWYLVMPDEDITVDVTYTKTNTSTGWGRLFVYTDGEQIFRDSSTINNLGSSRTHTFDFDEGEAYIIRVGGDSTTSVLTWQFEYDLTFLVSAELESGTFTSAEGDIVVASQSNPDDVSVMLTVTDGDAVVVFEGTIVSGGSAAIMDLDAGTYSYSVVGQQGTVVDFDIETYSESDFAPVTEVLVSNDGPETAEDLPFPSVDGWISYPSNSVNAPGAPAYRAFEVAGASFLLVTITYDIEFNATCSWDRIIVEDLVSGAELLRSCGDEVTETIFVPSNQFSVGVQSDGFVEEQGWRIDSISYL